MGEADVADVVEDVLDDLHHLVGNVLHDDVADGVAPSGLLEFACLHEREILADRDGNHRPVAEVIAQNLPLLVEIEALVLGKGLGDGARHQAHEVV